MSPHVERWYAGIERGVTGLGGDVTALDPDGMGVGDPWEDKDPTYINLQNELADFVGGS